MIIFVVSSVAAFLFYSLFYYYSPWIWETYTKLSMQDFTPWSSWSLQSHDGVEVFVLYPLVFAVIVLSVILANVLYKARGFSLSFILWPCALAGTVLYYLAIGFSTPVIQARPDIYGFGFMLLAIVLSRVLHLADGGAVDHRNKRGRLVKLLAAILLFFVCMIPIKWFVFRFDYIFIFTPALRTLHGFALKETYFQYDYLLSLLVMAWMKLRIPLTLFHLLGRLAFFVLIVSVYGFARKHFMTRGLAAYLVVSVAIVRMFGDVCSAGVYPQTTPLRLDWWFLLLVLVFWKGLRHWLVAGGLVLLVMLHHAFGSIYALSYGLAVVLLFIGDRLDGDTTLRDDLKRYFKDYGRNFLIIAVGFIIYQFFLAPVSGMAALTYQKYNVGFLPVGRQSFYWHILVMLSCAGCLLWKHRSALGVNYYQTTLFLIILAVGNSFYFFGRSDENNIIKISVVLLLVFFGLLDLVIFDLQRTWRAKAAVKLVMAIALLFTAAAAYAYSGRALDRMSEKAANLMKGPYKDLTDHPINVAAIKRATQGSSRIIILSIIDDFDYYKELGIAPQGYYCFTNAWLLKKDYVDFLDGQLTKGYYLVMPAFELPAFIEILRELKPHRAFRVSDYVIMKSL